ncbi:SpoIIE family protein phosphatase [Pseudochryseolinea flava]|nr:SpoIIE family protein phosphatase [Pseudochryseolinea flava]
MRFLFAVASLLIVIDSEAQQTVAELEPLLQAAIKAKENGKAAYYAYELAKIHVAEQHPEKASPYLSQGISLARKSGDKSLLYLCNDRMGLLLSNQKNYSKALEYYLDALAVAEELKKSDYLLESLLNVSTAYGAVKKYKKAIDPLERALAITLNNGDALKQRQCYALLTEYCGKIGLTDKANEYRELTKKLDDRQQAELAKQQEHQALEKQVQEKDAVQKNTAAALQKQSQQLRKAEDSLLATRYSLKETTSSLEEARIVNEKRQLEIDLLSKDKALADLRLQEQEARLENEALFRNSIIAVVVLLAILSIVLVTNYRRKIAVNKKIDQQNKNIKSSINYAQRIQEAMLPKRDAQQKLLAESFVLFKPRDIVSGDFYWFSEIKSWYSPDVVIVAADCTGHGVPGAFMSMIGINALNGIVGGGMAEPDQILQALDRDIRNALQQDKTGNNDGMDVALCIFRKEKGILEFAGAKNPLVYIQNGKLTQIKGDIHPIGGGKRKHEFTYRKHKVPIEEPTIVYLFSDGYRDQFGGKEGTKFLSKNFNQLLLDIHQKPMDEQKKILDERIESWKSGHPQTDDIMVIGFKLYPAGVV